MWSEKLKINKQILEVMKSEGYLAPKEIQEKTMTRIAGGQDIIAIAPEGSGKTAAYVLSILVKLKYAFEEAPRALVLAPDKERVIAIVEMFQRLGKNTSIRTLGVYAGIGIDPQMDALADGTDIVVGTPDRIRALYLKLGLNVNKILIFVLDDAELLIKQGFQLPVTEIARSLPKCQHLVFAELMHQKLEKLITPFLNFPTTIEVNQIAEPKSDVHSVSLFHLPNFKTKLHLLKLLLKDEQTFNKVVVIANTKNTADKLYTVLNQSIGNGVVSFDPINYQETGCESIDEFVGTKKYRILIVASELHNNLSFEAIHTTIFVDLPSEKELILNQLVKKESDSNKQFIVLATDIELSQVKKIEQAIGNIIPPSSLPENLLIEWDDKKKEEASDQSPLKSESPTPVSGAAFHEKKPSNSKQYNYGYKEKRKMSGKISKRKR